jgi:hypothetical protein
MAAVQLYSLLYCLVNGKLLTEEASVTLSRSTGSQAVMTVAKGYAGESPGAETVEIDVTNAVPAADFEVDAGPYMETLQAVEIGIVGPGGKTLTAKGFIIGDSLKHSVNSESTYDFKFRGGFAKFQ